MRRMLAVILALAIPGPAGAAPKLDDLVNRADMALWGKSSASVFSMQVKTKNYTRSFTIVSWYDGRDPERTLVKILGPALWRGHGTLKVGSKLKLFNPRSNHVTVVGHSMLGDDWMGSHFTNDDLVKETRLARHYRHALEKKWAGKNEAGTPVTFYRVKLTPRATAPVSWGKIIFEFWEGGGAVLPTRVAYFRKVKDSKARRTLTFDQVKELGGRTVPARMTMTVARKPGEHTAITYKKIKFDIKIPDKKFTEQALRH